MAAKIALLGREYVYLGFLDWHWPNFPVRFYGTDDVLAVTIEGKSLCLVANTQAALTGAKELFDLK